MVLAGGDAEAGIVNILRNISRVSEMPVTWPYLAGFIDGDGWITKHRNKNCSTFRYTVGVTQLEREEGAMQEICKFLNKAGIKVQVVHRVSTGLLNTATPMLDIRVREQTSLRTLLINILPYLLIKKNLAKECLVHTLHRIKQRGLDVSIPKHQLTNVYWTPDEIRLLLSLRRSGQSCPVIAAALQRSKHSVYKKEHHLRQAKSA